MAVVIPALLGLWAAIKPMLPYIIATAATTGITQLMTGRQGPPELPVQPSPEMMILEQLGNQFAAAGGQTPARQVLMESLLRPIERKPLFGNVFPQMATGGEPARRVPELERVLQG